MNLYQIKRQSAWQKDCEKIATWAESIGLAVKTITDRKIPNIMKKDFSEIYNLSFLPNLWIIKGIAVINNQTHPGSLLHDLGHLAVTPSWLRPHLSENLDWEKSPKLVELVESKCDATAGKGLKLQNWNALIHGDEQAAIAWSFVAAQAAGVDNFLPFEIGFENPDSSTGEELHDSLLMSAATGNCYHAGIASLYHGGMLKNKADFPSLSKWIQD